MSNPGLNWGAKCVAGSIMSYMISHSCIFFQLFQVIYFISVHSISPDLKCGYAWIKHILAPRSTPYVNNCVVSVACSLNSFPFGDLHCKKWGWDGFGLNYSAHKALEVPMCSDMLWCFQMFSARRVAEWLLMCCRWCPSRRTSCSYETKQKWKCGDDTLW